MATHLTQAIISHLEPKEKRYDVKDDTKGLFLRVEKSGRKTWYLKYNSDKVVKIGPADLISPAQARDKARQFMSELVLTGKDPREPQRRTCTTLDDLLCEYEQSSSCSNYIVVTLSSTWPRSVPLTFFNKLNLEKWQKSFCETHKIATSNRRITALKALLNWAESVGLAKNTVKDFKKLPETDSKTIIRYLLPDERERLMRELENMPQVFRAIVLVADYTGIRKNALLSLKWSDVNLKDRTILLRAENAKSRKTHLLPMSEKVAAILEALPHTSEYIFTSYVTGTRYDEIKGRWSTLLRKADIHNFRFHDLRHDFASQLVMKGVDINTVRELMTHSDINMTMRYAHLAPNMKKAAVDLL